MKTFKEYLEKRGLIKTTINYTTSYVTTFLNWMEKQNKAPSTLDYPQLLSFIGHLQKEGLNRRNINDRLVALSHYYECKGWKNIAYHVRLKGTTEEQKMLLTGDELNTIYQRWEDPKPKHYYSYSNHLILGLIIYQGLQRSEVERIELEDLDLSKGTIKIRSGLHTGRERILKLEDFQIYPFMNYLSEHRGKESSKLFSPNADNHHRISDQFKGLNTQVRELNTDLEVKKLLQLRQSRIAIWVKEYGLRKTQYLSGYRSINQIEKYKDEKPYDLKEELLKYHPMK